MTKRRWWLLGAVAVVLAAGTGYVYRVNREANQVAQLLSAGDAARVRDKRR